MIDENYCSFNKTEPNKGKNKPDEPEKREEKREKRITL